MIVTTPTKGTILIASWGNGAGHIMRCVALAKAARVGGWRPVIATADNPQHLRLAGEAGCETVVYPTELTPSDAWRCWSDPGYLRSAVEADLAMIGGTGAEMVIHDSRLSLPISAAVAGVRCGSICQQVQCLHFEYPGLGPAELWQTGVDNVNQILAEFGQPEIDRDLRELYLRGVVLLPSIPEFDPLPEGFPARSARFVGPITAMDDSDTSAPAGRASGVFFYRVVGVNASLPEFRRTFADLGDRVFIATSSDRLADELQRECAGSGFRIRGLWDTATIRATASVAVVHGGHGISMSCLQSGIPAVVLPGDNPERGLNGDRLEALGVGVSLPVATSLDTAWGLAVDATGRMPTWPEIRSRVELLAGDRAVRARCGAWRDRLAANEPVTAIDIVAATPAYRHAGSS